MKRLVPCLLVAARGGVDSSRVDGREADGPADVASDSGASCMTDGFDGSVLGANWSVLAGMPTTYDIAASRLFISDAPFVATPSMPATSWIYDLDLDKGNQIAWAQAIGGEDFTVTADLGWSSAFMPVAVPAYASSSPLLEPAVRSK